MAQGDGFAGELRHAAFQQHSETRGFLTICRPVAERLHHTDFRGLLSCTGQSRGLASLFRNDVLECLDHLPKIVLHRPGAFGRDEGNPLPESRLGDRCIAEPGGVLDERLEVPRIVASLDKRQDLLVVVLLFGTLRVGVLLLVGCHDCPFAVAVTIWPGRVVVKQSTTSSPGGMVPVENQRGRVVDPIRLSSIERAHWRPSRIAHTTSDWPRRMSPAANSLGTLVL